RRGARPRAARPERDGELPAAPAPWPEQSPVGIAPSDRVAASTATPEALRAMIERAAAGQVPLWIGWSIPRETAIQHAEILDEQLEDAIVALAPIYQLVAWTRDNDRIALDRRIESAEQERARAHAEHEAQTEKWKAEQAEARRSAAGQARARGITPEPEPRRPAPQRRPSLDTLFGPKPAAAKPAARAVPPAEKPAPAPEKIDK